MKIFLSRVFLANSGLRLVGNVARLVGNAKGVSRAPSAATTRNHIALPFQIGMSLPSLVCPLRTAAPPHPLNIERGTSTPVLAPRPPPSRIASRLSMTCGHAAHTANHAQTTKTDCGYPVATPYNALTIPTPTMTEQQRIICPLPQNHLSPIFNLNVKAFAMLSSWLTTAKERFSMSYAHENTLCHVVPEASAVRDLFSNRSMNLSTNTS